MASTVQAGHDSPQARPHPTCAPPTSLRLESGPDAALHCPDGEATRFLAEPTGGQALLRV